MYVCTVQIGTISKNEILRDDWPFSDFGVAPIHVPGWFRLGGQIGTTSKNEILREILTRYKLI